MDTRIPARFWSDLLLEEQAPELKLTVLWSLTNREVNFCGVYPFTVRHFSGDTGLKQEWHQKMLVLLPDRYLFDSGHVLVREYIREQIGDLVGANGRWNNLAKALRKPFGAVPARLQVELMALYPELAEILLGASEALAKGLPSPPEALGKGLPRASNGENGGGTPKGFRSPYQGLPELQKGLPRASEALDPDPDPDPPPDPLPDPHPEAAANRLLDSIILQSGIEYLKGPAEISLAARALQFGPEAEVAKAVRRQIQLHRGTKNEGFLRPHNLLDPKQFRDFYAERDRPLPAAKGVSKRLDTPSDLSPEERARVRRGEQIPGA
jgi:hypothetical protein